MHYTAAVNKISKSAPDVANTIFAAPDMQKIHLLTNADRDATLAFLRQRPVHTVVMTSFVIDNGMESELNRGEFYGYRNTAGDLEAVALIGHTTLVESRSDDALEALAFQARFSKTPINLVMSEGRVAEAFWAMYARGAAPRLTLTEVLFETAFPLLIRDCHYDLRPATLTELIPVAAAQAEVAFAESGIDPMIRDRSGFLQRVARRIDQGRIFVVVEDGQLIFKADIIAETPETAYLEGVYVAPEHRGKGIASKCLSKLSIQLLRDVNSVCLLSNIDFKAAHKSYVKAGFTSRGQCSTLFA